MAGAAMSLVVPELILPLFKIRYYILSAIQNPRIKPCHLKKPALFALISRERLFLSSEEGTYKKSETEELCEFFGVRSIKFAHLERKEKGRFFGTEKMHEDLLVLHSFSGLVSGRYR